MIVLDVMMPGRDGWEVLGTDQGRVARPRAADPGGDAHRPGPTSWTRSGAASRARSATSTKPFAVAELREAVAQALQGEPEPVKRRQAQHEALTRLARLERGGRSTPDRRRGAGRPPAARPHLTRLEAAPSTAGACPPSPGRRCAAGDANLSAKQFELLDVVGGTPTVREAAERLGVSRSYVYASLRRIARKLGVRSGPELVGLARRGAVRAPAS